MAATTVAAVLLEARKLELRDVPIPEIDADSGLARVEITGVCGADWPIYTGELRAFAKPPLIPGHEIVARIEKLGARAAARWGVREGDRIVMEEYAPCGRCEYCLSGRYYLCGGMTMEKMYGFTSLDVRRAGAVGRLQRGRLPRPARADPQTLGRGPARHRAVLRPARQRDPLGAARGRDRDRRQRAHPRARRSGAGVHDRGP